MRLKMFLLVFIALFAVSVNAELQLDRIQFDPAIIASGDEVDVVVQFHESRLPVNDVRLSNKDYTFKVLLETDDSISRKYITVQDAEGDDIHGSVFSGGLYNKRFRVKVAQDAPAGNYEFRLTGQWYHNGVPESGSQFLRFKMPVKREGIILDISTLETVPAEVRPGDNFVKLVSRVENVGEKDAKGVEINLNVPHGISHSYTNNNRVWIGRVNAGESKEVVMFLDIDENMTSGLKSLWYDMSYMDMDNNEYRKSAKLPFLIKSRPYLEVADVRGEGLAGKTSKLYVTIKNTGEESAEAVDVRILKQNSQPFTLDVRSDYVGELEPGEEGVAVFDIGVMKNAELKVHDFKLIIRSKGDSDEGDDNIYLYSRRAKFAVVGQAPNILRTIGLIAAVAVLGIIVLKSISRRKKK